MGDTGNRIYGVPEVCGPQGAPPEPQHVIISSPARGFIHSPPEPRPRVSLPPDSPRLSRPQRDSESQLDDVPSSLPATYPRSSSFPVRRYSSRQASSLSSTSFQPQTNNNNNVSSSSHDVNLDELCESWTRQIAQLASQNDK
ncbi:hypothetical protein AB6A40_009038 [Gnathostoma spinigerum]|uniref:Uncharacterized protein n=1 Tax=Gnathostoma spinigerum TaxID=75299 RepID=A0ABD6EVW6_9BILA